MRVSDEFADLDGDKEMDLVDSHQLADEPLQISEAQLQKMNSLSQLQPIADDAMVVKGNSEPGFRLRVSSTDDGTHYI